MKLNHTCPTNHLTQLSYLSCIVAEVKRELSHKATLSIYFGNAQENAWPGGWIIVLLYSLKTEVLIIGPEHTQSQDLPLNFLTPFFRCECVVFGVRRCQPVPGLVIRCDLRQSPLSWKQ